MTTQDANTHTVTFTISPDGTVEGQIEGILGPDCAGILESMLSEEGEVVSHRRTREYRLRSPQVALHRHRAKKT